MEYNQTHPTCNNCGEITGVFLETPINIEWEYKYICPHCNKESTFQGSISSPVKELPDKPIFAKPI